MQQQEAKAIAATLNAATRAGSLATAYCVIRKLSKADAAAVMLAAGHSVTSHYSKHFSSDTQASIAGACHARVDGWAYTANRKLEARSDTAA